MRRLRAILRMTATVVALAFYLSWLLLVSSVRGYNLQRGYKFRRRFTGAAMRILGVRLAYSGHIPPGPVLFVSNHRSLLDPLIQLHYIDAFIVSKAEVDSYPLIGKGARATGVIFVHRGNPSSRTGARDAIRNALRAGQSVLIYPEGTTSDLETTREFKHGSFVVATEENVPVVPVVIDYADPENYWSDIPMRTFFLRKFGKARIRARLCIGEPIDDGSAVHRREKVRNWINAGILKSRTLFLQGEEISS